MIRLVIFGAIAFILGLGGSTGVMVMTAPALPHGADSLLAARRDSIGAPHAVALHGVPVPVPVSVATHGDTATHAAPVTGGVTASAASTESAPAPVVTTAPPAPHAAAPAAVPEAPVAESFKQVGNILLNMKPAEAAKIVAYLNDEQVEGLLRSMSPRQAASVLAQLSPERGAALSRRLLIPARESRP